MSDDKKKFEMPQATESERIVIGSIMIEQAQAMQRINHILTYKDFYNEANRLVFRALESLYKEQKDIDAVTVCDLLQQHGYLEAVGGAAAVVSYTDDIHTTAHIVTHARLVADRSVLRNMIYAAKDIMSMTQNGNMDMDDMLNKAENRLRGVTKTSARAEDRLSTVDIEEWREIARNTSVDSGVVRGLSTGIKGLDDMLEGFEPGEMVVLTGHTKHGKSRLATNIAVNVAQQGKKVLFINTEMTKLQTARRINGILDDIKITGQITVNDRAGLEYMDVIHFMERAKEKGFDLVVVDHLHYFSRSVENQTNEISKITKDFKDAAVRFELPLLVLCHVQQGDTRKPPTLQMLKNSSSIAQDADVVITVWMDDKPSSDGSTTDVIRLAHRSAERNVRKVTLFNNGMRIAETDTRSADQRTQQQQWAEDTARMLGEKEDNMDDLGEGW